MDLRRNLRLKRILLLAAGIVIVAVWAAIYYTGDQAGKVAESGFFTIDTTDPTSITQTASLAEAETSSAFTIDTRDSDSVALAASLLTMEESTGFTIDTTDPDNVAFVASQPVAEYSATFTIDTRDDGVTRIVFGDFTIDTRDPDAVVFAASLSTARMSAGFTIDTTDPTPEDSDNDGLHDLWERLYFGTVFTSGLNDDPDGDGLSNFYEFATGTNPTVANAPASVELWFENGPDGPRLKLRYWRHILAARMVKFEVQLSTDLQTWTDATALFTETGEVLNGNGYVERITLVQPLPGPPPAKQFARLKITRIGN